MLKQTVVEKIASLLKLDSKKLSEAIKDEKEMDITISDDIEVLDKNTLAIRDKNKYDEGKKAGREMLVKEIAKENDIDSNTEDHKKVIEAITEKVKKATAATPDERLTALEGTVAEAKKKLAKVTAERDELQAKVETLALDTKLLSHFPANTFKALTREEMLHLVKSDIKIEVKDGKETAIKKGQPVLMKDSLDPMPVGEVISGYFKERNWIEAAAPANPGGRGGDNSNPGGAKPKFSKLSEVNKWVEESGNNIQGQKGQEMIQAAIKENPGIDLRS